MSSRTAKTDDLQRDIVQPTDASGNYLTTDHGVKVSDTDNWYVASTSRPSIPILTELFPRLKISDGTHVGPHLLEDQIGREKISHFDHERIPERVVHARGAGAFGYFKLLNDHAAKYTSAPVLTDTSRTTPVFVRFSTVQGSRGSAVGYSYTRCFHRHLRSNRIQSETSVDSRSSSTRRKETGILSATTCPSSSFKKQ